MDAFGYNFVDRNILNKIDVQFGIELNILLLIKLRKERSEKR